MKLTATDGSFFNLDIPGYQYPANEKDFHDSNWLMIQIHAGNRERSWSLEDPCLNVFDIERLIQWLQGIALNTQTSNYPPFMEPFINFKLLVDRQGGKSLQISCKHHPSEKAASGEEDITVIFPFKAIDFEAATGALREQLAKFPQRVFHEHVLVVISGLTENQTEQGTAALKAEFTQHPWIKKSALKWDSEQNLLIARIIYEYQQHTVKEDARQSIKDSVSEALSFSKKESFMVYDIPA